MKKIVHKINSLSNRGFGVHSPFAYQFCREVLHPKGRAKDLYRDCDIAKDKYLRLLFRMKKYFGLHNLLILSDDWKELLKHSDVEYGTLPIKSKSYDLLVLDAEERFSEECLTEEAFVVFTGSREAMQTNPLRSRCNAFFDLYTIGICVFKKGLSSQEFKFSL